MILVLDNYDSFTFNLVQYLGEFGLDVDVRRNDTLSVDDVGALAPDAVVISPGPCTPAEAGISVPLVRRWGATIPILGVCLGHQAIVEAYGGKVIRAGRVYAVVRDELDVPYVVAGPLPAFAAAK